MAIDGVDVLIISDKREVIHEGRPYSVLAFDLRDLIDAMGSYVDSLSWFVSDVECVGGESEQFMQKIDAAGPGGLRLSGPELRAFAARVDQVVDGTFVGFPKDGNGQTPAPENLELANFPQARAQLVIRAVDSTWFEVYTKDTHVSQVLRARFKDVRAENPTDFFAQLIAEGS